MNTLRESSVRHSKEVKINVKGTIDGGVYIYVGVKCFERDGSRLFNLADLSSTIFYPYCIADERNTSVNFT